MRFKIGSTATALVVGLAVGACASGGENTGVTEPSIAEPAAPSSTATDSTVTSSTSNARSSTSAETTSSVETTTSGAPTTTTLLPTTTAPTTTVPSPSEPVDLAEWPSPGQDTTIRAAPAYLPSSNIPEALDAVRFRSARQDLNRVFDVGTWISTERDAAIQVSTRIPWAPTVPADSKQPIDTSSWTTEWDEAFLSPTGPETTAIKLFDADAPGVFEVRTYGLAEALALEIAATARRVGPGQTGWRLDAIPDDFAQFGPTNEYTGDTRSIVWANGPGTPRGELRITTNTNDILNAWFGRPGWADVDVNGTAGISVTDGDRTTVIWEPEPDVYVIVSAKGAEDEVLALARSITPADDAQWNAASVEPFGDYSVVCTGMFC
jgi:hypothetical protein